LIARTCDWLKGRDEVLGFWGLGFRVHAGVVVWECGCGGRRDASGIGRAEGQLLGGAVGIGG
jgi:hypothetical protein